MSSLVNWSAACCSVTPALSHFTVTELIMCNKQWFEDHWSDNSWAVRTCYKHLPNPALSRIPSRYVASITLNWWGRWADTWTDINSGQWLRSLAIICNSSSTKVHLPGDWATYVYHIHKLTDSRFALVFKGKSWLSMKALTFWYF